MDDGNEIIFKENFLDHFSFTKDEIESIFSCIKRKDTKCGDINLIY